MYTYHVYMYLRTYVCTYVYIYIYIYICLGFAPGAFPVDGGHQVYWAGSARLTSRCGSWASLVLPQMIIYMCVCVYIYIYSLRCLLNIHVYICVFIQIQKLWVLGGPLMGTCRGSAIKAI